MNVVQAAIERALGYAVAWDDTAAWVQAFGTTAGVLWGVWLYKQAERDRQRARVAHQANAGRACAAALRFAASQLVGMNRLVNDPVTLRDKLSPVTFDRLSLAEEMLKSVQVLDAEDPGATDALMAARSRVAQARRRADEYNDNVQKRGAATKLADLRRQLNILQDKLERDAAMLTGRYGAAADNV